VKQEVKRGWEGREPSSGSRVVEALVRLVPSLDKQPVLESLTETPDYSQAKHIYWNTESV